MNPQETQSGPGPMRGAEAQAPQGSGPGPAIHVGPGHGGGHGGCGHGYGPSIIAGAPWGGYMYMAPWSGPHPYPYAHPYGSGFAPGSGPPPGWAPPAAQPLAAAPNTSTLGLNNRFVMGMLVGGALTYVLTNEAIQRAAIRGIMQVWLTIQGGIEETKERFRDAESEIKAARHE